MAEDQKIKDRIEDLIRGVKSGATPRGTKKTRVVFSVLNQVEIALSEGVPRAALAAEFGWPLRVFEGALYRARRLKERRNPPEQAQTKRPSPAGDGSPAKPSRPTSFSGTGQF